MKIKIILLFTLIFLAVQTKANGKIEKIEPPFWWAGMRNQELQLMVYGKNIGSYQASINYPGVELKKVNKVENNNYLFLDLTISPKTKPDKINIQFTKGNQKLSFDYEIKQRKKRNNKSKGFGPQDAIYLIMPDRFANGNPKNDNTNNTLEKANRKDPDGRHGGDIQGIKDRLDYIKDLGFTAIWLNPVLENNMPKYSYHGYAITDFYNIDPRHGSNEDYIEMVQESHKKGIKVIMDQVINHCGAEHWFIKDLPMNDWIHQFDKYTRTNYRISTIFDPHASRHDKELMITGWFDTHMPDLNQKNPYVAKYLTQNSIWWIEFSGINGIRLDTQPYAYPDMVSQWAKAIMQEYPDFNIVGESWLQKEAFTAYFQKDTKIGNGYNSNIPSVTDFPLHYAWASAFNEEDNWTQGTSKIYDVLCHDYLYANPNNNLIFLDNHDISRYYTLMNRDTAKLKMGIASLLTMRGIPMIYYGTEILMQGEEQKGHGYIRKDFPGGWEKDTKNAFTKEGRTKKQNDIHEYIQNILTWRQNKEVIHTGKLTHYVPENGLYIYFRHNKKETVMVILNNSKKTQTLNTKKHQQFLSKYTKAQDIITGKTYILPSLKIKRKQALILELK